MMIRASVNRSGSWCKPVGGRPRAAEDGPGFRQLLPGHRGAGDTQEILHFQRGAADKRAADMGNGEQSDRVRRPD
jgi:hypothetical protein